jgi:hypothetical protein
MEATTQRTVWYHTLPGVVLHAVQSRIAGNRYVLSIEAVLSGGTDQALYNSSEIRAEKKIQAMQDNGTIVRHFITNHYPAPKARVSTMTVETDTEGKRRE